MSVSSLDIQKKTLEILEADPTLAAYVKDFSIGRENVSRMKFPYVTVVDVHSRVEPRCIGPGAAAAYHYTIRIQTGTNHVLPEIAHAGDNNGKKGIVQLNDDVANALYPGTLDGIFKRSVKLVKSSIASESGGRTWKGKVCFRGFLSV